MIRFLFCVCAFFLTMYSRSQVLVDSYEYQLNKERGTLSLHQVVPEVYSLNANNLKPIETPSVKSLGCSCFVQPDSTYTLAMPPNDDGSTQLIPLPFDFCFFGDTYNSLYINNNGNVSFSAPLTSFTSAAFPSISNGEIVTPFWADVDTRGIGEVLYKITPTAIYINWQNVGYYSYQTDKTNTFQLILTDGSDPAVNNGNVAFCYGDMMWTTGAASAGINGFEGIPAIAGMNYGNGINSFQIGRFDHSGADYYGNYGIAGGVDWLDYKSFTFDACFGSNQFSAPLSENVGLCDTFKICSYGDTADILFEFGSLSFNQINSISYTTGGFIDYEEIENISGADAKLVLRVDGNNLNAGDYEIIATATNNASPPESTTRIVILHIDSTQSLQPQFNNSLNPCGNAGVTVLNGPYDSYLWNDLSRNDSLSVNISGNVGVTISKNGCHKRIEENIYVQPLPPTPIITTYAPSPLCNGDTVFLVSNSAQNIWSNGATSDTLIITSSGSYAVATIVGGCQSNYSQAVTLSFGSFPIVNFDSIPTLCLQEGSIQLSQGTPQGGIYSGIGVGNGFFDPSISGVGNFYLTYVFTPSSGCSGMDSSMVVVLDCLQLDENGHAEFLIYPNPASDIIHISSMEPISEIRLIDATGRLMLVSNPSTDDFMINTGMISDGVYSLEVYGLDTINFYKIKIIH